VTEPMQQAFLAKHPDFYEQLVAERKKFVEDRLAEDIQRRDELNSCLDDREAGRVNSPSCKKFMAHEITRGIDDRHRRRCAVASLDDKAAAQKQCEGLSEGDIADEVQRERTRRERSQRP